VKGGTLFSGIGTPELAGPWVDWRWSAEIDPFASAVHAARFPNIPNLGDVTRFPDAVEPVGLIVFGSPCQSFSIAGKRAGLDDARGNLALIGLQIVDRVRPDWLVFENVPGLLSSDEWRDFGTFLGALGECGYGFAYRILDAQYAGVPQRRRRVFVVGYLGDWRPAAAVLFERDCLSWNSPPGRETREGVAGSLSSRAPAGGGLGTDFECGGGLTVVGALAANGGTERKHGYGMGQQDYESGYAIGVARAVTARNGGSGGAEHDGMDTLVIASAVTTDARHANVDQDRGTLVFGGNNTAGAIEIATACNAHGGPSGRLDFETETFVVTHSLRAEGFDASEDGTGRGTPIIPIQSVQAVREKRQNGIGIGIEGGRTQERQILDTSMAVRRLTPRECERLQGFPDDFTLIRFNGKPAADGPRYRALGNAMAVPVIGWVLDRIKEFAAE
jgi:DNA (cytosine-5)-methyltransferase 1